MLNKLDILSGIDPIRLCVAYEIDGRRVEAWPSSGAALLAGDADLRRVPRLGRADPRRPLAGRPARERPPLRRPRSRSTPACRSSSCRSGRSGRRRSSGPGARCASRAGRRRHERGRLVMPTRILIVGGGGREHALAWKLAAEPGVNEVVVAPGQRRDRDRAAGPVRAGRRPARRRRGRRGSPARSPPSWSSSGPRRRSRPASRTRCATPGSRSSGRARRRPGSSRARRSATRSPRRPASRWPARASFDDRGRGASRSHGDSTRPGAASSSRPTVWRPARA